jgi:hypothetical protein
MIAHVERAGLRDGYFADGEGICKKDEVMQGGETACKSKNSNRLMGQSSRRP